MDHFGGLDVSVIRRPASALWMTRAGSRRKLKVTSEPEALLKVLANPTYGFKRIGLEAVPLFANGSVQLLLAEA